MDTKSLSVVMFSKAGAAGERERERERERVRMENIYC
jgi:hypothetical protein